MTKLQKKVATAIATGALLFNTALPAFADVTLEISGNGADTYNKAEVDVNQNRTVVQSNEANISNNVTATADTGDNDANRNTGGSVSVDTGNATTKVDVSNAANSNEAELECCEADVDVLISGNGDNSTNKVELDVNDPRHHRGHDDEFLGTGIFQENEAKIDNDVTAKADTGDNDANRNTGGDVSVTTGDAKTTVDILNQANANSAKISGDGEGGSLSARILGNGADSYNKIELDYNKSVVVDQSNSARVENDVYAKADTGDNDANRNTGGTVSIDTGDAETKVGVDNMINFNWADVDCGCVLDVLAKIAGNGDDSTSKIEADLKDELGVFQENSCGEEHRGGFDSFFRRFPWHREKPCLENDLTAKADSGDNDAERNTGDPGVDPSVETGNAYTEVLLDNSGNSNVYGNMPDLELPEWLGGGFSVNISLDLSALLALLGLA